MVQVRASIKIDFLGGFSGHGAIELKDESKTLVGTNW